MNHSCNRCGDELVLTVNWTEGSQRAKRYRCKVCHAKSQKFYAKTVEYTPKHLEYLQQWRATHPEHVAEYKRRKRIKKSAQAQHNLLQTKNYDK